MSIQCDICLKNKENLVVLEHLNNKTANHSLCQDCLDKLHTDTCPFCRDKIKILKFKKTIKISYYMSYNTLRILDGMSSLSYSN